MAASARGRADYERLVELEREAARLRQQLDVPRQLPLLDLAPGEDPEVWTLLARFGSDFFSLHLPSGVYRYASPSVSGLFGWEPEALIGQSAYDYFHPDDLDAISRNHNAHAAPDPVAPIQYRFRCADGDYRWVETRSKALRDDNGVHTIVCITRDVADLHAERMTREALVAELSRRLEQIETLEGLLPICSWCKSVRDDQGYWSSVESYLERSARVAVTHGICPNCDARQ